MASSSFFERLRPRCFRGTAGQTSRRRKARKSAFRSFRMTRLTSRAFRSSRARPIASVLLSWAKTWRRQAMSKGKSTRRSHRVCSRRQRSWTHPATNAVRTTSRRNHPQRAGVRLLTAGRARDNSGFQAVDKESRVEIGRHCGELVARCARGDLPRGRDGRATRRRERRRPEIGVMKLPRVEDAAITSDAERPPASFRGHRHACRDPPAGR